MVEDMHVHLRNHPSLNAKGERLAIWKWLAIGPYAFATGPRKRLENWVYLTDLIYHMGNEQL